MEMFTIPLSIIAFLITLWVTSFLAGLMRAKKPEMIWIFIAWITATLLSIIGIFSLRYLLIDKLIIEVLMYLIPLFLFTFIYRLINKMNWMAAITTTTTAFSVGIIAVVMLIISLSKPLDKTIIDMATTMGFVDEQFVEKTVSEEQEEESGVFSEQELLNPQVRAALEAQKERQQQRYKQLTFKRISTQQANTAIGYKIRLAKTNGKVFEGTLSNIQHGQLIIEHRLYGGVATTPIALNSVKKLEVYR
jgi:hypothetical protein